MHFDLQKQFEVKDYSLQVYDQHFRSLLYQGLLGSFLHFFITIHTKIVRYFIWVDQLIKTFL